MSRGPLAAAVLQMATRRLSSRSGVMLAGTLCSGPPLWAQRRPPPLGECSVACATVLLHECHGQHVTKFIGNVAKNIAEVSCIVKKMTVDVLVGAAMGTKVTRRKAMVTVPMVVPTQLTCPLQRTGRRPWVRRRRRTLPQPTRRRVHPCTTCPTLAGTRHPTLSCHLHRIHPPTTRCCPRSEHLYMDI